MRRADTVRIELPAIPDLLALHAADPLRFPCLLESAAEGARGRYDLLLVASGEGIECRADGAVRALGSDTVLAGGFLDALDAAWRALARPRESEQLFDGGWALFLGYELAGEIEPVLRMPAAQGSLPRALALRCPLALVVDRELGLASLQGEGDATELIALVQARMRSAVSVNPGEPASAPLVRELAEDPPEHFLDGVRRALEYIAAGDVFQVNLSRAWHARLQPQATAEALYAALRQANPAPFSAMYTIGAHSAVICSSPERLVSRRGRRIETRPIAGTRPRLPGDDDRARIRELVEHPKERAEHIMLIDLERNDLGRVCEQGSVRVEELMAVETYAHVHHIESTVSGVAREGVGPAALIRAVFPGGTITGCPKVRCMQIIGELEGVGRGPYTGAVGWLGRCGDLDLNILIRTLWIEGDRLCLRAGAGIVADSDPEHELAETRAKAKGLLRALGCTPP